MEFTIMTAEEAKKATGWDTHLDQEYKGVIPPYLAGYNFEIVTKEGQVDFMSCYYACLTPQEIIDNNDDYYRDYLDDLGVTLTGRVIFRGYYVEDYDYEEHETYLERVEI